MIGSGTVFPLCPQHQVANLAGSLNGSAPVVLGAVVGGPNGPANFEGLGMPGGANKCPPTKGDVYAQYDTKHAKYEDNVTAWPSSEPALDYTVGSLMLFTRVSTVTMRPPRVN